MKKQRTKKATTAQRRHYCVSGQTLELWEDPDVPFGWSEEDVSAYASSEKWESLFNALVLSAQVDEDGAADGMRPVRLGQRLA